MNRRTFFKDSCLACLGLATAPYILSGCKTLLQVSGTLTDNGIKLPLAEFVNAKGKETKYHSYVVVHHDALQYPICVYRFDDATYVALYMKCSHQGAELQVSGDRLTCPAHGSEFDNKGLVKQGPAAQSLRSFPTSVIANDLFIDLRKLS